jgi:hypothetical protein
MPVNKLFALLLFIATHSNGSEILFWSDAYEYAPEFYGRKTAIDYKAFSIDTSLV